MEGMDDLFCCVAIGAAFYMCFGGDQNRARAPPRAHQPRDPRFQQHYSEQIYGPKPSPYSPYGDSHPATKGTYAPRRPMANTYAGAAPAGYSVPPPVQPHHYPPQGPGYAPHQQGMPPPLPPQGPGYPQQGMPPPGAGYPPQGMPPPGYPATGQPVMPPVATAPVDPYRDPYANRA
mmetsp:Transcript_7754/g.15981  ORF Transcript_7754/g.15981 Transcript_7754/m.15981 type:complete len:176 (-) Transcript_7754:15-542(-)